jgi:hypothetical protein
VVSKILRALHSQSSFPSHQMKRFPHRVLLLLLLCPAAVLAKESKLPPQFGPLHILEVGLNGEYVAGQPTSVRLQIANPLTQPLTVELRLTTDFDDPNHRGAFGGDDKFSKPLTLSAGEQRELELPVILPFPNDDMRLEVTAVMPDGRVFAHDRMKAGGKLSSRTLEGSVGLLCVTDEACKEAQQQAQFSGTMEERVDKNKKLHFITVREPRAHWWAYTAIQSFVLAAPLTSYTPEQRSALEDFLRRGGRLILLEKEIADPTFLSAYRQGPTAEAVRVGRGKLYRVDGLQSQTLGGVFTGGALADLLTFNPVQYLGLPNGAGAEMSWLRRHAATQFTFPRLRWLLIWLTIYVLVIGMVNFAILRRLRRLEWGWITILAGALLFAAGFYISSSWQRPKQFTLDDLAVYWMDQHSANAYGQYGLRISAPQRQTLKLRVADSSVVWSAGQRRDPGSGVNIGAEIRERRITPGMEFKLGPPQEIEVTLLRWSFADHNFEGARRFAGSVREVAPGHLRNETGVELREALFVDYDAKKVWRLGALAPGAEVSLAGIPEEPLYEYQSHQPQPVDWRAGRGERPALIELARQSERFNRRIVFGLSASPTLPAELAGTPSVRHDQALFVVGVD